MAEFPKLLRSAVAKVGSSFAVDTDSATFSGDDVTQLIDERIDLELQVATLQARRRDAEANLVKRSGRL